MKKNQDVGIMGCLYLGVCYEINCVTVACVNSQTVISGIMSECHCHFVRLLKCQMFNNKHCRK